MQQDQIFILTEAHQGIPIFEWILHNAGKNQMTENAAALIMRAIFQALSVAREKGLVHRDLRSENVLIKEKIVGQNKYCDDEEQSPFAIQIINFGQMPTLGIEDLLMKNSFSKL
jgi:serine/threonine protein kinase